MIRTLFEKMLRILAILTEKNVGPGVINGVLLLLFSLVYFHYQFESADYRQSGKAVNIIFRAAQDFGVGCLLLFYAEIIFTLGRKMAAAWKFTLFLIPVALLFSWSAADVLLVKYSGYRLEPAYFSYFRYAGEFLHYKDLNPVAAILTVAGTVIAVLTVNLLGLLRFGQANHRFSRRLLLLPAVPIGLGVAYCTVRNYAFERNANPVYKLSCDPLKSRLQTVSPEQAAAIQEKLLPRNDLSVPDNRRFPLFKTTSGFRGPLQIRRGTGPMPRHVIIIFWESARGINVGALGRTRHSLTPCFDRLSRDGLLFRNFYATGVHTSRAVLSTLFGVLPLFSPFTVQENHSDTRLRGLPAIFAEKGYETAYFFPGPLGFCRQDYFFSRNGVRQFHGDREISREPFPRDCPSWNVFDYCLLQYCRKWIRQQHQAGKRTFMLVNTTSNHIPIRVAPGMPPPPASLQEYYVRSLGWSDRAIYDFIASLKQDGIYDHSLIVIMGDHGCAIGDHPGFKDRNPYEESILVPLLILCPAKLDQPTVIDSVGSQIDLMPTLLDLLEMTRVKNHFQGRSLLRATPEGKAFFACSLASYPVGLRSGRWKYIFQCEIGRDELYDLVTDPAERHNLAFAHPELVKKFRREVIEVNAMNTSLILNNRLTPPENPAAKR